MHVILIPIQILTVNYSTDAELSPACNLWRNPFTVIEKKTKPATTLQRLLYGVRFLSHSEMMALVFVNEISERLRPVWVQWLRAGTKAAKVSSCSWQAFSIRDSLLIFTGYCPTRSICLRPHFQSGGPPVRRAPQQTGAGCATADRSCPRKETLFSCKGVRGCPRHVTD